MLRVRDEELDLARFERLTAEAERARARDDAGAAAALLREALGLWRGPPLADLAYESFARAAVERLEELRLAALEERIEAELALGRHAALVAELEALVAEHPLRERLRGQLMLALYRSGRQAEALEVYRATRQLARRELRHRAVGAAAGARARDPDAGPVARARGERRRRRRPARCSSRRRATTGSARSSSSRALVPAPARRRAARRRRGRARGRGRGGRRCTAARARTAAFTSDDPAADLVRLATANEADLVLVDAPPELDGAQLPAPLAELLERSPAHVAVLSGAAPVAGRGVHVPFGGGEHDWAALELGAWLASATGAPLRLVGTRADPRSGRRDASRLLADASLAVQRVVDVDARSPCSPTRTGSSTPSRTPASSRSASRRAGATRASAPPAARSSATRGRPCCSSTAARARACSRRARAARASPGRSMLERQAWRGQSATRSSRSVAPVVTSQPIRGETYCPHENVP